MEKDDEGCIFLDRDPTVFKFILMHLRNEPVPLHALSVLEKHLLRVEAEFYELDLQAIFKASEEASVPTEAVLAEPPAVEEDDVEDQLEFIREAETFVAKKLETLRAEFAVRKSGIERMREKLLRTVSKEKIKL